MRTWHDPDQYLSHKITEDQAPEKDFLIQLQIFVPYKTTVIKGVAMKDHKICFEGEIIVLSSGLSAKYAVMYSTSSH